MRAERTVGLARYGFLKKGLPLYGLPERRRRASNLGTEGEVIQWFKKERPYVAGETGNPLEELLDNIIEEWES